MRAFIAATTKPSAIKPIVFTAEKTIVRKSLGAITERDTTALREVIDAIIG